MSPKVTLLDKHIADRVKAMRKERDMTQPDVAGVLGISYQSYQKMERGSVSFRASTLDKLAILFGVPVSHFFMDGPAPALRNGREIASVVGIMGDVSQAMAKSIVENAVRVKSGQRSNIQA